MTDPVRPAAAPSETSRAQVLNRLRSRQFAGVWVLIAMLLFFGVARPDTFPTTVTVKTMLSDQTIIGLLALAVMVPLVAGLVDLSVANIAGFALIVCARLSSDTGLPTIVIIVVTLLGSMAFGLLSAIIVTRFEVSSLVATLGVGTVALGLTEMVAGHDSIIVNLGPSFTDLTRNYLGVVPLPFVYVLVLGAVIYFVLEHTTTGRRLQACGGNPTAARLAGIRVERFRVAALMMSALLSGLAGIILAGKIGIATDSTTPGLLLPTAAAVFLGSTQFKSRPNVAGTILAVLILGTGIKGLQLLGAEAWATDFFAGSVLLIAVSISSGGFTRRIR